MSALASPATLHARRGLRLLPWMVALAMTACGGGGDEAPPEPAPPPAAAAPAAVPADAVGASDPANRRSALAAGSTALDTTGIASLFSQLGAAWANPAACAGSTSGMAAALSTQARLETPRSTFNGRSAVAGALCAWAAEDGLWGATLAASTPSRCAVREGKPVCRVNVDLQPADGSVRRLGRQMAVTQEGGAWKLVGHVDALSVTAFAAVQRERRLDSGITVDRYSRNLVIAIPAREGLACARATQTDATGQRSTLAFFKPFEGLGVKRLSVWRTGPTADAPRSLDAQRGDLRRADDAVLALPEGSAGDAIVQALNRDGGSLRLALFADAACTQPLTGLSGGELEVGVEGTPPLQATLAAQAWPQLGSASAGELRRLGLNSLAGATISPSWTGLAAGFRPELAMLCVDELHCAPGDDGRIGERALARSASLTTLTLKNRREAVVPADFKLLSLAGRSSNGLVMLADFHSCASTTAGKPCPGG